MRPRSRARVASTPMSGLSPTDLTKHRSALKAEATENGQRTRPGGGCPERPRPSGLWCSSVLSMCWPGFRRFVPLAERGQRPFPLASGGASRAVRSVEPRLRAPAARRARSRLSVAGFGASGASALRPIAQQVVFRAVARVGHRTQDAFVAAGARDFGMSRPFVARLKSLAAMPGSSRVVSRASGGSPIGCCRRCLPVQQASVGRRRVSSAVSRSSVRCDLRGWRWSGSPRLLRRRCGRSL